MNRERVEPVLIAGHADFSRADATSAVPSRGRGRQRPERREGRRRGILLLELVVAAGVLGVLIVAVVPIVRAVGMQRRLIEQQALALAEVNALLEQARIAGKGGLPGELSEGVRARLPGARLVVESRGRDGAEGASGEWLGVAIEWTPAAEVRAQRVGQVAWVVGEGTP